jgi:hypothetical protein
MLSLEELGLAADEPTPEDDALIKNGRYQIADPFTGEKKSWTRASNFGKTIVDTFKLNEWHVRTSVEGFLMRPDLAEKYRRTMENFTGSTADKREQNRLCKMAADAAGAKKGARLGTLVHNVTEEFDRGNFPIIPDNVRQGVLSYLDVMTAHGFKPIPHLIEKVIVCGKDGVNCAGRFDRGLEFIGETNEFFRTGQLLVGDVKTAKNIGYSWLEVVQQLAIYANASHIYDHATKTFEPFPTMNLQWALVMSVPAETQVCELFRVDIEQGWELCKLNLLVRQGRRSKGLAFRLDSPNRLAATDTNEVLDWSARIDKAMCVADLSAIFESAYRKGEWTDELEAYGLNRMHEIRG